MNTPEIIDERVRNVTFDKATFSVELYDGRTITVPIAWFPRLVDATEEQRAHWQIAGAVMEFTGRRLTRT